MTSVQQSHSALWLIVITILVATTWPGQRGPENHVMWGEPGPGLVFEEPAQSVTEAPLWVDTGSFTLELWLESDKPYATGNHEIVSIIDQPGVHRLLIGQFNGGLILRGRRDNPSGDPRLDLYLDDWPHDRLHHIAILMDTKGTRLWVNGHKTEVELLQTNAEPGVPFGGLIVLGNSNDNWAQWRGSIFALAVHGRTLSPAELAEHATLRFDSPSSDDPERAYARREAVEKVRNNEALAALYLFREGIGGRAASELNAAPVFQIPKQLSTPIRPNLATDLEQGIGHRRWLPVDITLNFLGFVPLGFVIATRATRNRILTALAFGLAISLTVEVAQFWIPDRDSSLIDLVCNAAGAAGGGFVAYAAAALRGQKATQSTP